MRTLKQPGITRNRSHGVESPTMETSSNIRIENDLYLLEVEPEHGALTRLRDKVGRLELITEPRLAENFRLLLPMPGMQANYILGTEQKLSSTEKAANGMKLSWTGPLRNERGAFNLDVTIWIELIGEEIQFR